MTSSHTITVVYCLMLIVPETVAARTSKSMSEVVEELFNEPRYNSRARPGADTGKPLDVFININVNDISSISEMRMEFSTTLYLRQIWRDERLSFDGQRNVTLNHKQFDRMWTPDVFIRNLKSGIFHTITVPNRLIRLSPDGTILYSQRLTLTLACDMLLNRYPMDNQTCKIEFGSYAYTTEDLVFKWRTDAVAVEVNPSIRLPEYDLTNVTHNVCAQNINSTGSFPCLRAHFHLERRLRAYVLSTFLPSLLVVLLSWVSFWIDLESVPARISLGILTMLTITTQSSGHLRGMPAVSFTKAIDVWMATCLVFVFGSFIEYSVVNVLARREKSRRDAMASSVAAIAAAPASGALAAATAALPVPLATPVVQPKMKDSASVNSYSPYQLLFRRKSRKSTQSPEERQQEMIPLTNVQAGMDDYGTGSDAEQSPARRIPSHQYAHLHHFPSGGASSPPHHCYYRSQTAVTSSGGSTTALVGCDCQPATDPQFNPYSPLSSVAKPTPGTTVECRLIEAQWNGGNGGSGRSSSVCGGDGVSRGGGGTIRHRVMVPAAGSITAATAGLTTTSTKYMQSQTGCIVGCGLGERICRCWRVFSARFHSQAQMVDVMSRVLFPMMFIVFNLVYWPFYLVF